MPPQHTSWTTRNTDVSSIYFFPSFTIIGRKTKKLIVDPVCISTLPDINNQHNADESVNCRLSLLLQECKHIEHNLSPCFFSYSSILIVPESQCASLTIRPIKNETVKKSKIVQIQIKSSQDVSSNCSLSPTNS